MSSHLTAGQQAWLRAELEQRRQHLERRLNEHRGGRSRIEYAREVRTQDDDDAPQREGEREVDLAISDFETQEFTAVGEALRRIEEGSYGLCVDCGVAIPFDRLRAEPWARRCVACATAHERSAAMRRR